MSRILRSTDVRSALKSRQRGFIMRPDRFAVAGGGGDPAFANVSFLMNEGGTLGSQTVLDKSLNLRTLTTVGGTCVWSNTQSKFGGTTLRLPNSGYINITTSIASLQFGTGDFTIEFWYYANTTAAFNDQMISTSTGSTGPTMYLDSSAYGFRTGNGATILLNNSAGYVPLGQWHYYTVTREGGVFRRYYDGVLNLANTPAAANLTNSTFRIGCGDNGSGGATAFMDGWLGPCRVTKGVARYNATFAVPTGNFPES